MNGQTNLPYDPAEMALRNISRALLTAEKERDALLAEVERLREQLRQAELERDMLLRYGVPRAGVADFLDEADDDRR